MPTFQIHIKGIVQGVGFRPYVYQTARKEEINGWVLNGSNGVQIEFNYSNRSAAQQWLDKLIINAPKLSRILSAELVEVDHQLYNEFTIRDSIDEGAVDLPLTPDFAMCQKCKEEILDNTDRRFNYAFITCTNCGPRYSITRKVPYDRPTTTMDKFYMCTKCQEEYNNPENRRHYSQTNSCPSCGIKLEIYDTTEHVYFPFHREAEKINFIASAIHSGQIVAVKGIGGYLLMCDARDDSAVSLLRERKHRPHKPLAVMYPDLERIKEQYVLSEDEKNALISPESPIVLLRPGKRLRLCHRIAPGLDTIGVMLPYAPLLYLLAKKTNIPLIATSGNISGAPIIYKDEEAIEKLSSIADWIVTNNREILIPQDDSVIRYGHHNQRVILRRSRGFAPNYFNDQLKVDKLNGTLAVGAEMKGAFGLVNQDKIYLSQYLGAMHSYYSQESFEKVLSHISDVLDYSPKKLISDRHPGYFGFGWCEDKAAQESITWNQYQHHETHFASVLGENNLLDYKVPVLGFIWDGTGLSPDGHIWGSETFLWQNSEVKHIGNIGEVPHLSGDRMALQPMLSLFAFTQNKDHLEKFVRNYFDEQEWNTYKQVKEIAKISTSSMGRLFDAVSCLLTGICHSSFEGQSAMYLETLARNCSGSHLCWSISNERPFHEQAINQVYHSFEKGENRAVVALTFHHYLVQWIHSQARETPTKSLAFSGGVFQNVLLMDLILDQLSDEYDLYFHKDLSPNDENIAHGQLMLELINLPGRKDLKKTILSDEAR